MSDGFAWSISATVPATTGAAMLVPDRLIYGLLPSSAVEEQAGVREDSRLVASLSDTTPVPGAKDPAWPEVDGRRAA